MLVGAIVDQVQKVIDIPAASIQPSSFLGTVYKEDFIIGIGKADQEFIMILNVDKVFTASDILPVSIVA